MHLVDQLFVGPRYATSVWISEAAKLVLDQFIEEDARTALAFLDKVDYYAQGGFHKKEGNGDWMPLRHEWDDVYRIGVVQRSDFRLIGFYEDEKKKAFIVIDGFMKTGHKLRAAQQRKIDEVARVKKESGWQRRP